MPYPSYTSPTGKCKRLINELLRNSYKTDIYEEILFCSLTMRLHQETAVSIANTVRRAAAQNVYGFRDRKPSVIYFHSDIMRGVHVDEVLALLNPPILARIGIKFWQADESRDHFPDTVFESLLEQSDSRPGVTFSHTPFFARINRLLRKTPKENKRPRRS